MADKTEISLTRQDLVELINVRVLFIYCFFSLLGLPVSAFYY